MLPAAGGLQCTGTQLLPARKQSLLWLPFVSMEGSSGQGSWRGVDLGRNLVWFSPAGAPVWSHALTCPLQPWWGQDRKNHLPFEDLEAVRRRLAGEGCSFVSERNGGQAPLQRGWGEVRMHGGSFVPSLSCIQPSGDSDLVGLNAVSAPACIEATSESTIQPVKVPGRGPESKVAWGSS